MSHRALNQEDGIDERIPCGCGHDLSWHDDTDRCCHDDCDCKRFHDADEGNAYEPDYDTLERDGRIEDENR